MTKWSRRKLTLAFGLVAVLIFCTVPSRCFGQSSRSDKQAWGKVVGLAETLIGKRGLLDAKGAEEKLDALVVLHTVYCADVMGKRMSSQRVVAIKQGLKPFFKTVGKPKPHTGAGKTVYVLLKEAGAPLEQPL